MTNTVAIPKGRQNGSKPRSRRSEDCRRRSNKTSEPVSTSRWALLTPIVGQEFLDKYNLRDPLNRTLRYGVKTMFSTAGATTRQFKRVQSLRGGPTRLKTSGKDYYDLTPDEDQKLIVETVEEFAEEILRPAAHDADEATPIPRTWSPRRRSWGSPPSTFPRISTASPNTAPASPTSWSPRRWPTATWGWPCRSWRPAGVAAALTHWGSADQQATYLKEFAGENVPQACVAIAEPQPLFDPTALKTTAVRTPSGYRLDGVKSLVPAAANAELFVVCSATQRQARACSSSSRRATA